jgi:single-strand DNA-binding protein
MRTRASVRLEGYVGQEPESKPVGDYQLLTFSVAVNRKLKGVDYTDWYSIEVWGKMAETYTSMIEKGSPLILEGELMIDKWESGDKQGTTVKVNARYINLLGRTEDAATGGSRASQTNFDSNAQTEGDIPF